MAHVLIVPIENLSFKTLYVDFSHVLNCSKLAEQELNKQTEVLAGPLKICVVFKDRVYICVLLLSFFYKQLKYLTSLPSAVVLSSVFRALFTIC